MRNDFEEMYRPGVFVLLTPLTFPFIYRHRCGGCKRWKGGKRTKKWGQSSENTTSNPAPPYPAPIQRVVSNNDDEDEPTNTKRRRRRKTSGESASSSASVSRDDEQAAASLLSLSLSL